MESIFTNALSLIASKGFAVACIVALVVQLVIQFKEVSILEKSIAKLIAVRIKLLNEKKQLSNEHDDIQRIEDELASLYKERWYLTRSFNKKIKSIFSINYEAASMLLSIQSITDSSKKKTNTVVGMMLKERAIKANKISLLLVATIIVYLIFSTMSVIEFSWLAILFPCTLLLALHADQYLITYRIRKGLYGRNEYEAREIIEYILSHADKDDFNDEGGLKKLMDEPERGEDKVAEDLKGWVKA
ncbi:hypothetical protein [Vibrio alginolyticus]|uniref:hypothetical protein n=1 Tax=Vibrio alginolyticus TaxID=663 RepID=UPI001BD3B87D|nr:hypothetical protein [Vibrio alginolyticus]MBT0111952.1 hypothetical protein [Vibrio alginolyticus]